MAGKTLDYGIPADHDCADLLLALMTERYGPLRRLERERFSVVVPTRPVTRARPAGAGTARHAGRAA